MKLSLSTLSAAMLAAASALPALALTPNQVTSDASKLFVGGSTATNQSAGRLVLQTGGLCAGSIDVYTTATDPGGLADDRLQAAFAATGAGWAVLCTGNASSGGGAIGYYKENNGGSGNGVTPVATAGATLNYLDLGTAAAPPAPCASGGAIVGTGLQSANVWWGCTAVVAKHPDAGVSDVNPELLNSNKSLTSKLTANPLVTVVFGTGVSLNLYRALQAFEGFESTCGTDNNGFDDGDGIDDCDEAVNVPSFTAGQLRALLVQFTTSWGNLTNNAGTALNSVNPPGRDVVFICRRGDSSGTEATFESNLLNQRCTSGVQGIAIPDVLSEQAGGVAWAASHINETVFAGSGTGEVAKCLQAHDANGDWAIGLLSTEQTFTGVNTAGGGGFHRYVGIDRANPDLLSVVSGNYELWSDSTWNVLTTGGPSGTKLAISNWVKGNFGSRVPIDNVALRHATGDGGLLAQPFSPNAPPTPPFNRASVRANPTNPATRSPLGVTNDCNPPIVFGVPTELGGENQQFNTANEP
jgi:hypothetical protein